MAVVFPFGIPIRTPLDLLETFSYTWLHAQQAKASIWTEDRNSKVKSHLEFAFLGCDDRTQLFLPSERKEDQTQLAPLGFWIIGGFHIC
jgi:hypothetical protein